jgi:hypothetical protein
MFKLVDAEVTVGKVAQSETSVGFTDLFDAEAVLIVAEAETTILFGGCDT